MKKNTFQTKVERRHVTAADRNGFALEGSALHKSALQESALQGTTLHTLAVDSLYSSASSIASVAQTLYGTEKTTISSLDESGGEKRKIPNGTEKTTISSSDETRAERRNKPRPWSD
jgi:hypothetical protein